MIAFKIRYIASPAPHRTDKRKIISNTMKVRITQQCLAQQKSLVSPHKAWFSWYRPTVLLSYNHLHPPPPRFAVCSRRKTQPIFVIGRNSTPQAYRVLARGLPSRRRYSAWLRRVLAVPQLSAVLEESAWPWLVLSHLITAGGRKLRR